MPYYTTIGDRDPFPSKHTSQDRANPHVTPKRYLPLSINHYPLNSIIPQFLHIRQPSDHSGGFSTGEIGLKNAPSPGLPSLGEPGKKSVDSCLRYPGLPKTLLNEATLSSGDGACERPAGEAPEARATGETSTPSPSIRGVEEREDGEERCASSGEEPRSSWRSAAGSSTGANDEPYISCWMYAEPEGDCWSSPLSSETITVAGFAAKAGWVPLSVKEGGRVRS